MACPRTPRSACGTKLVKRSLRVKVQSQRADLSGARSMDEVYERLALQAWDKARHLQQPSKMFIGIAGTPGSGKSTAAFKVADKINKAAGAEGRSPAIVVQMDGFHLYKKQLDAMPNRDEAYARRGAHWTFDAERFVQAVRTLKQQGQHSLPSFDHAVGDPVENDILIHAQHRVVLIEGLYVLLDEPPWDAIKELMDESWFVDADIEAALERVIQRQVANGAPHKEAAHRVATNDRVNAELVYKSRARADLVLPYLPLAER
ncbi:hypothetical protein WJX73_005109 [Symbiochloris irregularis]|uniref:Phosphoribulokinase/uridine kinase domain-containing protein n=1 Tax=Symbiochloris irregularis TaxID=706552 RepID=A0AAW1PU83_9CHLO